MLTISPSPRMCLAGTEDRCVSPGEWQRAVTNLPSWCLQLQLLLPMGPHESEQISSAHCYLAIDKVTAF